MREKRSFADRTKVLASQEVRKKYFLVFEGKKTEELYFNGITSYRREIGISPLIELIPIVRSYSEQGWSNPKKILDRVQLCLDESEEGAAVSYESILNSIMEYLSEERVLPNSRPAKANMWNTLMVICEGKMQVKLSEQVNDIECACSQIVAYLMEETQWNNIVVDVPAIIERRSITYDKSLDKICFIIDRDKDSFISTPDNNQYGYVLEKCRENNYGFYLSNPCFEFWLLMHFDEVTSLDQDKLLENPRVSATRRYTEQELRKLLPRYSKSKYSVAVLIDKVSKAIENAKRFCQDEEELEHCIGSRVGLLMEELLQQSEP